MNQSPPHPKPGRLLLFLGLVAFVQSIYPITRGWISSQVVPVLLILYQMFYSSLMIVGILVARQQPRLRRLLIFFGLAWFIVGPIYAFNQTAVWAALVGYVIIAAFQATVILVLMQYIFTTNQVNRDVIYAACAVYFLIGAVFIPIYGLIETATFFATGGLGSGIHAFSAPDIRPGELFPWQTFVYYSYVTLTTLGYGDILPVTMWARSAVSLEAIIGVLYITVIMARLVGLYASTEVEKEFQHEREAEKVPQ